MTAALIPDRLATGRIVDLADLSGPIDWLFEMAGPAARLNRFAGQVPDLQYSVAEHEVHGADAIYAEQVSIVERELLEKPGLDVRLARTRPPRLALAFLLHDQEETLGGDVKRPFADLCELIAAQTGLVPGGTFRKIVDQAKAPINAWIYGEAGLDWPLPFGVADVVHAMDERMAAEEMRRFWPEAPLPVHYRDLERIGPDVWPCGHAPTAWAWPLAQTHWIDRFQRWRREVGLAEEP